MTICFPIFLIFVAVDLYFVIKAFREWYFEAILSTSGVVSSARVVTCERKAFRPGNYNYFVAFRFELNEKHQEIKQMVSKRYFLELFPGAYVKVSYLPHSPQIARLLPDYPDRTQRDQLTITAFVITIVTLVLTLVLLDMSL